MPLGEYERQVLLFNLHVVVVPEEASDAVEMNMPEAIAMLQQIYNDGEGQMFVGEHLVEEDEEEEREEEEGEAANEGENVILIREISIDKDGIATILLHHGDAAAADPALMKLRGGKIRKFGKQEDEGVAHAAHLLISTKKHLSSSGQSRALLERVPNLGRSAVITFLNRLLRLRAVKARLEYEDKKAKRQKRYHPKFAAQQQLSHRLRADLEQGKLSRVEFITRKVAGGFEEKNRVVPVTQIITHKIIDAPTGNRALELIKRLKSYAVKHNFEEMQIHFTKTDTDQHISPRFATDINDAEDAIYSRFEVLSEFDEPLEQCPIAMVKKLRDQMSTLFAVKELWK
jgi:hypothetical protein